MKVAVCSGKQLKYTPSGSSVASGGVVAFAFGIGVALAAIADGVEGVLDLEGGFELPKLSSDDVSQGDLLYWDEGNTRLTKTAGSNTLAGFAYADAGNGATTVVCILKPLPDSDGNLAAAANQAVLGTTTDLVGVDGSGNNAAPLAGTESRLDAIEAAHDALLVKLKAAGLMVADA